MTDGDEQSRRPMQVLLVEDSVISAEAVRRLLHEATTVEVELSHVECLADVSRDKARRPDLVLLDLFLPDCQGVETIRGLQRKLPGVPIVVLTADSSDALALDVVRAGAQDYIVKGRFDADALIRSMRYAIERAHGEQLKQQLIHADRLAAIGRLVAGVAHEISNPATFVLASTGLLTPLLADLEQILADLAGESSEQGAESGSGDKLSKAFAKVHRVREICEHNASGIDRICSVVRDLRGFSRFEPAEAVPISPNNVVEDVSHLVANSLRHQARLSLNLHGVPPIALPRGRLDQILTNLLMNAVQAMPHRTAADGVVEISTFREGAEVAIAVEDNGSGITEEQQRHVFEPFFTTKPRGVGLGLGLSICREIARAHGGDITCTSVSGLGSRFEVRFPVASESELRPVPPSPPLGERESERARVLFIDDEPQIREVYQTLLSTEFDVTVAEDGRHAVELIGKSPRFDVIVSDLMMPQMGAVDLIDVLREIDTNVVQRFVVYTGGALSDRAQALVDSGEVALLYKPLRIEELTQAIRRRLRHAEPHPAADEEAVC